MGALADLRARVAAALAPAPGDPWAVHPVAVDAVTPPAYMLTWSRDRWLVPATHCSWTARLDVMCIANRIDLQPGQEMVEDLVEHAIPQLRAAGLPPIDGPEMVRFDIGGTVYLAGRLTLTQPVTL